MNVPELIVQIEDGRAFRRGCKACHLPLDLADASQVRRAMAELYVDGWAKREIWKQIKPWMDPWPQAHRISWANLRAHLAHFPPVMQEARALLVVDAALAGVDLDAYNATGRFVSGRAVISQMLAHGLDLMNQGRLKLTAGDVLRLAMIDHSMTMEADLQQELAQLRARSEILIQVVQQVVPPEFHPEIMARVAAMQLGEEAPARVAVAALDAGPEDDYQPPRSPGRGSGDPDEREM